MNKPRPAPLAAGTILWQSGLYKYDGSGNIVSIGEGTDGPSDGNVRRYEYDALGRLRAARMGTAATSVDTQTYSYDIPGNLEEVTTVVGTLPPTTLTLSPDGKTNRLPAERAAYDVAGYMTEDKQTAGGFRYQYDELNMMTSKSWGSNTEFYIYTASDERIGTRSTTSGATTTVWTLRDEGGRELRRFKEGTDGAWTWVEDHVYRDGALLGAERAAGTSSTLHFHLDHLGTPRLATSGGVAVMENEYRPFGAARVGAGATAAAHLDPDEPLRFTGHARDFTSPDDALTSLDYMHARYYDPGLGRFLSADPMSGNPHRPQSWNRYSYVENNPIGRTDPTGESWVADVFTGIDNWWNRKMNQWFPPKQVAQNDPNREALNDPSVGNTPAQTERLVNPAGAAQRGLNDAGATLGSEFSKQAIIQLGSAAFIRTVGFGLKNVRTIESGRLKGFIRGNTEIAGGAAEAEGTFANIAGRAPRGPFDRQVLADGTEVVFRASSTSGPPKVEIIDKVQKTLEKISFVERP